MSNSYVSSFSTAFSCETTTGNRETNVDNHATPYGDTQAEWEFGFDDFSDSDVDQDLLDEYFANDIDAELPGQVKELSKAYLSDANLSKAERHQMRDWDLPLCEDPNRDHCLFGGYCEHAVSELKNLQGDCDICNGTCTFYNESDEQEPVIRDWLLPFYSKAIEQDNVIEDWLDEIIHGFRYDDDDTVSAEPFVALRTHIAVENIPPAQAHKMIDALSPWADFHAVFHEQREYHIKNQQDGECDLCAGSWTERAKESYHALSKIEWEASIANFCRVAWEAQQADAEALSVLFELKADWEENWFEHHALSNELAQQRQSSFDGDFPVRTKTKTKTKLKTKTNTKAVTPKTEKEKLREQSLAKAKLRSKAKMRPSKMDQLLNGQRAVQNLEDAKADAAFEDFRALTDSEDFYICNPESGRDEAHYIEDWRYGPR